MFDITTYIWATKTASVIAEKASGGKTIKVETSTGQLDEDALNVLKESNASMVILNGKVYRLSRIEGITYKYINSKTDGTDEVVTMTELDINIQTGEFSTKILVIENQSVEDLERRLNAHIHDTSAHLTEEERAYWNTKVSADATQVGLSTDYDLNLSR